MFLSLKHKTLFVRVLACLLALSLPPPLTPFPTSPHLTWNPYLGPYLISATCTSEMMEIPLQASDHKEGKQAENKRFPIP